MAMQFQGFKPEAMQRIAGTLGYDGDMSQFDGYLEGNPEAKQKMGMYNQQAVNMMNGGMVRSNYAVGGDVFYPTSCPSPDTLIDLLDGNKKQAGKLLVGDMLRTQHEDTLEWGDYPVSHVSIISNSERLKLIFDGSEIVCSLGQ